MGRIFQRESAVLRTLICTLIIASVTTAGWAGELPVDLTELSLEELMNIEITSVSKKEEKLFEAAAAGYVVTGEEIRRSGVTNIPEALRMVPGMHVARIDANKWAVSSRGFNARFATKLLVLMDGRSVYTPIFSGVFWDMQDVLLEDVERIEVIRGPGATLWGANAVNGIINIITKSAKDTQGNFAITGVGSEERGFGGFRYGGKSGDDLYYRFYAKYFNRDSSVYASGEEGADGWDVLRGGFRMDWDVSSSSTLTLLGDMYGGEVGHALSIASLDSPFVRTSDFDGDIAGASALGRWEHIFSEAQDIALQVYCDRTEREEGVIYGGIRTFDIDFQHRFGLGEWQEIVWGSGYRFMRDEYDGTFTMSAYQENRDYDLISAFVQNEITVVEDRFRLTLGSKFEQNDHTGFEIQPNVRLLWTPDERHTAWASLSRAVRTPSRAENNGRFVKYTTSSDLLSPDAPVPLAAVVFGDRNFESEELLAFELGYRIRPTDRLFLDVATFHNVYDKLRTGKLGTPFSESSPAPEHLVVPIVADNEMGGNTCGIELAADWWVLDWWRLHAAYAYLKMHMHLYRDSKDILWDDWEQQSPDHQFSFSSSMDLPGNLGLDLGAHYVDDLTDLDIESYLTLDVRLGWKPLKSIELSLTGQNLFDNHHPEFDPELPYTLPTELERGVYGAIRWRF